VHNQAFHRRRPFFSAIAVIFDVTALKYCPLTCCKLSGLFRCLTRMKCGCRTRSKIPYFLAKKKVVLSESTSRPTTYLKKYTLTKWARGLRVECVQLFFIPLEQNREFGCESHFQCLFRITRSGYRTHSLPYHSLHLHRRQQVRCSEHNPTFLWINITDER